MRLPTRILFLPDLWKRADFYKTAGYKLNRKPNMIFDFEQYIYKILKTQYDKENTI